MSKYVRKTIDEYEIQGNYGYSWDYLCSEFTYKQAKQTLKEYRENESQYLHKIVHKRIKLLGKKWKDVKNYLESEITVDQTNVNIHNNCIVDFTMHSDFSIIGKQVITENEVIIEIDNNAIIYCNNG
jgi:hypothetical protein